MCIVGQVGAKCYCVFVCSSWKFFNSIIGSFMCWKFVFQILMSLSHCKDTQGKCRSFRVDILKRCGSYMGFTVYHKWSLAKLNIKHRMCCNEPIDYKMLSKFFRDIIAWLYGEGGNSHIYWGIGCAIIRALSFSWNIKILGSIFLACNLLSGQILLEH